MTARVDTGNTPMRLLMAVTRLRARARTEGGTERTGLSLMQLAILGRVTNEGSRTAAQLAQSEHVSQQAIAQSLAGLKERRLVQLRPDPDDGRKALIELTVAGRELLDSLVGAREAWLARAIDEVVEPGERETLEAAIEILERLADAPTGWRR
jgi:DNA-binding MarR family transcriptional regulator